MASAWKIYDAALVGLGRIGYSLGLDKKREQPASHTMALLDNPRISLLAGVDSDELKLKVWKSANKKASVYSDSANLYARSKLDIVTVAVNEESHLKESLAAISSKPRLVILEKPVALNMKEALRIKEASEINKVPLLINHERRFADDYILAKNYMKEIGDLISLKAVLHSGLPVYNPAEESSGAYSLLHDGTHLADIVLFFLEGDESSSVKTVQVPHCEKKDCKGLLDRAKKCSELGFEEKIRNDILFNPLLTGLKKDEKGCIRQLTASYTTSLCTDVSLTISGRSSFFGFEVDITGTKGRIRIGNGLLELYKRQESPYYSNFYSLVKDEGVKLPKKTKYFSNMIKNAVDFLDGKAELKSTLQNGINALAVLEEIKEKIIRNY